MGTPPPKFSNLDTATLNIGALTQDGKLYSVPLTPPQEFVSSTLRAVDVPSENDLFVEVKEDLAQFVAKVEDRVRDVIAENRQTLFAGKNVSEEGIKARFKSYLAGNRYLKIKVTPNTKVFDTEGEKASLSDIHADTRLRAIIVISQVLFGKSEFGLVWSAVQLKLLPLPRNQPLEPEVPEPAPQDVCLIEDVESINGEDQIAQQQIEEVEETEVKSVHLDGSDESAPPKKRRGRKPKQQIDQETEPDTNDATQDDLEEFE